MKKTEKYLNKHFKNLRKDLKSYGELHEAELLHQVRVGIKKIKAVINLINDNDKGFKSHKAFKPLRDIFRRAGDIRQPEVMFQLLLEYGVTNIKRDTILDQYDTIVAEFTDEIPGFIKTIRQSQKRLSKRAGHIDGKSIIASVNKLKKKIGRSLTDTIDFDLIHKTRKLIKQVLCLSEIRDDLKKKEHKFFDELQELIGSIHDKQMLMILLRKPAGEHEKIMRELKTALESDKRSVLERCAKFYS